MCSFFHCSLHGCDVFLELIVVVVFFRLASCVLISFYEPLICEEISEKTRMQKDCSLLISHKVPSVLDNHDKHTNLFGGNMIECVQYLR